MIKIWVMYSILTHPMHWYDDQNRIYIGEFSVREDCIKQAEAMKNADTAFICVEKDHK